MPTSFQNSPYFICHIGMPGRSGKKGAGLYYQNGQLTEAGRRHYYGERRLDVARQNVTQKLNSGFKAANSGLNKIANFGKKITNYANNAQKKVKNAQDILVNPPKKQTKEDSEHNKQRAKKILIAAGAVTLAAAIAYGVHRYNKTTDTLSQLAKKKIDEDFNRESKNLSGIQLHNKMAERTEKMYKASTRYGAKKELGVANRTAFRSFMKNNNVRKMKAVDIAKERYKGYLDSIKGMKRDRWTGEMRNYTPKELERLRRKVLKSYMNTPGG